MICATVNSQPCVCWLYRASPCFAANNIVNLILVLTIWWCPCVESSLVLLEESVYYELCIVWQNSVTFSLLHFVPQGQTCLLLLVSLVFLKYHPLKPASKLIGLAWVMEDKKRENTQQMQRTRISTGQGWENEFLNKFTRWSQKH